MEATHTARLKSIGETIEAMKTNISYGTMYIKYLSYKEGSKIELTHHENDIYHSVIGGWSLNSEMLTDIQPIAKVIEIPAQFPWWFTNSSDQLCKINEMSRGEYKGEVIGSHTFSISLSDTKRYLNNGTWTICEAPEKKMRAWNYEELEGWFCSDGWYSTENFPKFFVHVRRFDSEEKEVWVDEDFEGLDEDKGRWISYSKFMTKAKMRSGNKFEKEIK